MASIKQIQRGALVALGLVLLLAIPGQSADDPKNLRLQDLDKITGSEVIAGAVKSLVEYKPGTKKLLQEGLALVKEKKPLSYNAAYVLALVAGDMKDLKASEAFFRICMEQAAKLQSTKKIIESYGGRIDLFSENKKYSESARVCQELLELKTDDGTPRIVMTHVPTRAGAIEYFPEEGGFDTTRILRPGIQQIPDQFLANWLSYRPAELFFVSEEDRRDVEVKFAA